MGLLSRPRARRVSTSKISSRVPSPPGSARKASDRPVMISLRSDMVSVSTISPLCSKRTPGMSKNRGATPMTVPPPRAQPRAAAPIRP